MEESGNPIVIYPEGNEKSNSLYQQFSPNYIKMTKIGNYAYPSISHYIFANLFALIPEIKYIKNAYLLLLKDPTIQVSDVDSFLSHSEVYQKYEKMRIKSFHDNIKEYAKIALDQKFTDRGLQDILLLTGNAKLVWADFSDTLLGTGGKKGENFVGKYLMKLRTMLYKKRGEESVKIITTDNIDAVLQDSIMLEWVKMRVRDMCRTINIMKNYIWVKDNLEFNIDTRFAEIVLDVLYNPCNTLSSFSTDITAPYPRYFEKIVQNCPGFSDANENIVNVFWKRIAVMIYFVIRYQTISTIYNIKVVLVNMEKLLSKKQNCISIVKNESDNCIVSALLNIMSSIKKFNEIYSYNSTLISLDITTAATLILNRDVSEEIEPIVQDEEITIEEFFNDDQIEDGLPDFEDGLPDFEDESELPSSNQPEVEEYKVDITNTDNYISVQDAIVDLDKNADSNELTNLLLGAIETIKTYNISKKVKQNRINFFATLQ